MLLVSVEKQGGSGQLGGVLRGTVMLAVPFTPGMLMIACSLTDPAEGNTDASTAAEAHNDV